MNALTKILGLLPVSKPAKPTRTLGELRAEVLAASICGDHERRDRALREVDALIHAAQGGTAGAA